MLPGVIIPDSGIEHPYKIGDVVGVIIRGNPFPLAVGKMLVTKEMMIKSGMRGKGVEMVHTYADTLWASGSKEDPPEVAVNLGDSDYDGSEEESRWMLCIACTQLIGSD
jgi:translation initiation factor 2D